MNGRMRKYPLITISNRKPITNAVKIFSRFCEKLPAFSASVKNKINRKQKNRLRDNKYVFIIMTTVEYFSANFITQIQIRIRLNSCKNE
jgi:hypothetical protein